MLRNLMIDIALLAGSDACALQVVRKREDRGGGRDQFGPWGFLHLLMFDAPGNSDFGLSHPRAFEFLQDLPPGLRRRDCTAIFEWAEAPMLESPPPSPGPKRNLLFDVEALAGVGAMLHNAILVPKRHAGPPPGWTPSEPGETPPTEHFGPDVFVHAQLATPPGHADDLTDPSAQAREFLQGAPATMRRADGGPLHVFLGQPVYETKPVPEPPVPP